MSIVSGDKVFYYMSRDSLCFLTMTESRYPKRLSFLYLDEIADIVLTELVNEFGNNVSARNKNSGFNFVLAVVTTDFFLFSSPVA